MYQIDADDDTIQSDPQFNNGSVSHEFSDSDEVSNDSLQEDVRSLTDRSVGRRSLPSIDEIPATEVIVMPEAHAIELPEEESGFSHKKSKKARKSQISAKRALFE
jgi:hypothetical protein